MNAWEVWNCFLKQEPTNFLLFTSECGVASGILGKMDLCSGFAFGTVAQLAALRTEMLYVPKAIKCDCWHAGYGCCRLAAGWELCRGLEELYKHLLWVAGGLTSVNVFKLTHTHLFKLALKWMDPSWLQAGRYLLVMLSPCCTQINKAFWRLASFVNAFLTVGFFKLWLNGGVLKGTKPL